MTNEDIIVEETDAALPLRADLTPVQSIPSIFVGVTALLVIGAFVILKLPFSALKRKIMRA